MSAILFLIFSSVFFGAEKATSEVLQKLLGVASSVMNSKGSAESRSFYDLGLYFDPEDSRKADFFCRAEFKDTGWVSATPAFRQMELLLGFEKFTPDSVWFNPGSKKLIMTGGHDEVRFVMQGLIYCREQNFVGLGGELELVRSNGSESMMIHLSKDIKR